jgi:hypothetical protein
VRTHVLTLATLAALAAGCGEPERTPSGAPASGSPEAILWHAVRDSRWGDGPVAEIQALRACRLVLRFEQDGAVADLGVPRALPAGGTMRLWWRHAPLEAAAGTSVPPDADAQAGRTERHDVRIHAGWEDAGSEVRALVAWTRPGLGRVVRRETAPPRAPEPLPRSRVELLSLAVADVARGEARWIAGPDGSRLVLPADREAGDRSAEVRLWLEVLPP